MFFSAWRAERSKLKHSPMWLAFFLLPLIPAFFGTINYLNNLTILDDLWYSLWTQHTLFSCYFFLPLVIGIYCAYLWRLEHTGHNWNLVLTVPISRTVLILAKLAQRSGFNCFHCLVERALIYNFWDTLWSRHQFTALRYFMLDIRRHLWRNRYLRGTAFLSACHPLLCSCCWNCAHRRSIRTGYNCQRLSIYKPIFAPLPWHEG